MVGQIVCSKAGRDKGYFMVAVDFEDGYVYVCDGKERPLARPKRKNTKHVGFTNTVLEKNSYATDRALRRALAAYRESVIKEEPKCLSQI